ncbi:MULTISPECIES: alpha/beta fold hydrolase [unclassified Leisingera]|uniref:alpha/beta fold hydrolase n=1 Tax=unclassified Leisingera TaxID=2614906 RepID=UPI0003657B79|nr:MULTISPECIES: alpha/beta hydrolase [unclassified Leisingera]KIC26852.1 alpha/beta hydrolase [Leisingera sp. ANG-S3]KIC50626.1 alpha/beta hydrolase [Leisingera sp. ANG-S]KID07081.1 alpha/beta hydrolase [Leisingera sp. ANG1]
MTSTILPLSEPYGAVSCHRAGEGSPLVLIHGVGMQSAAWGPQIEAFAQTHEVIALDMPGHGGSAPLPEGAELPDYVAWLHAVLQALDLGPVSLAGHSMGALIAGGYAVSHPENAARVALLNGVFRRSSDARAAVEARAAEIRAGSFDLETPLARWFGQSETDQAARAQVGEWLSAVNLAGYAAAYTAFARGDSTYADGFAGIPCPLLALTGDGDPNSTPAMAQAMADAAPQGRAVVIEGHRHMVNLTAPAAVNAALQGWLDTEGATS